MNDTLRAHHLTKDIRSAKVANDGDLINYVVYEHNIEERKRMLKELYHNDFLNWKEQMKELGYDL